MMAAASIKEGFLDFEYSDSGFCNGGRHEGISVLRHGHPYKLEVFCVDLVKELNDDFSDRLPHLKFIKVDTEGYDLYVLKSMKEIISTYKPTIKAEVFKKTDIEYRRELLSFFQNLGYSVFKIAGDPITPGPILSEENLQDSKHYDILCVLD
jgi:hypothetical protein